MEVVILAKRLDRGVQMIAHDRAVQPAHQGVLATKVGYFGVKSANVGLGPDGHLIC